MWVNVNILNGDIQGCDQEYVNIWDKLIGVWWTKMRTCSREKVENDALCVVDTLNKVPAWITDASSVGCRYESEYRRRGGHGKLTPVRSKATFEVLELEVGDSGAGIVGIGGSGPFVLSRCTESIFHGSRLGGGMSCEPDHNSWNTPQ